MSDALTVTDPRARALTVAGEKTGAVASVPEPPPAADPPQPAGMTWNPHDRVPRADGEVEC